MEKLIQYIIDHCSAIKWDTIYKQSDNHLVLNAWLEFAEAWMACEIEEPIDQLEGLDDCTDIRITRNKSDQYILEFDVYEDDGNEYLPIHYKWNCKNVNFSAQYEDYSDKFVRVTMRETNNFPNALNYCSAMLLEKRNILGHDSLNTLEIELIPFCEFIKYVSQLHGSHQGLLEDKGVNMSLIDEVLATITDSEFKKAFMKYKNNNETKMSRKFDTEWYRFLRSDYGHCWVNDYVMKFQNAYKDFSDTEQVKQVKKYISDQLLKKGFEGEYPFFRRKNVKRGEYISFADYRYYGSDLVDCSDGESYIRGTILTAGVGHLKKTRQGDCLAGLPFEQTKPYDCWFGEDNKCTEIESFTFEADYGYIDESLDAVERLFSGKHFTKEYLKTHQMYGGDTLPLRMKLLIPLIFGLICTVIVLPCFYIGFTLLSAIIGVFAGQPGVALDVMQQWRMWLNFAVFIFIAASLPFGGTMILDRRWPLGFLSNKHKKVKNK